MIRLKMTSRFRFGTLISLIISCMAGLCSPTFAIWSEGGHNLIAIMAFRQLEPEQQQTLISLLREHPQFATEFKLPDGLSDRRQVDEHLAGRAGNWPDVARSYKEFDRPTWHYQLGATKSDRQRYASRGSERTPHRCDVINSGTTRFASDRVKPKYPILAYRTSLGESQGNLLARAPRCRRASTLPRGKPLHRGRIPGGRSWS